MTRNREIEGSRHRNRGRPKLERSDIIRKDKNEKRVRVNKHKSG